MSQFYIEYDCGHSYQRDLEVSEADLVGVPLAEAVMERMNEVHLTEHPECYL